MRETQHHDHHHHQQLLILHPQHQPVSAAARDAGAAGGGSHALQPRQRAGSRLVKGVGEIVEVQGGHIVRSTGRKDRHSKVCTAKGPRDRRVRLSAHTAIKFYDVQDRLGYDRPSKAVDWLMKNAKAAIDELAELPPWDPISAAAAAGSGSSPSSSGPVDPPPSQQQQADGAMEAAATTTATTTTNSSGYDYGGSAMLPPALETDAIADTIKSFFPVAGAHGTAGFATYPNDLLSRTNCSNQAQQDLRLSLQSYHDSLQSYHSTASPSVEHQAGGFYSRSAQASQLAFDSAAAWPDPNHRQLGRWSADDDDESVTTANGGHFYSTQHLLPQGVPLYPVLTESSYLSHTRGTLQSSTTNNSHPVRSWAAATDPLAAQPISVYGYASNGTGVGFSGVHLRAGSMQVDGEDHGGDGMPSPTLSPVARH